MQGESGTDCVQLRCRRLGASERSPKTTHGRPWLSAPSPLQSTTTGSGAGEDEIDRRFDVPACGSSDYALLADLVAASL